ncbi:MAG TPA: hypothetical protein VMA95_05415 [Streptosporangiaceae bacterium]|nr:hypothetical protein [Streptosporangiaceae bacterium]
MRWVTYGFRSAVALTAVVSLAAAGTAHAGTPATAAQWPAKAPAQKWTKISGDTGLSIASAGLLRTGDGRLHVVWPSYDGNGLYSLHYSTIGGKAKLLSTGTIFSKWGAVSEYPRLVPGPSGGIRMVFTGSDNQGGSPFDNTDMFTATSDAAGQSWTLVHGSMSTTSVPLTDTSAVTESGGTPVAAWSVTTALKYHVGVDGNIPSVGPDETLGIGATGVLEGPTLVRAKDGGVWAAWFNSSGLSNQGYWVDQLLPKQGSAVKAPSSGGKNLDNNQPGEATAFVARAQGGEYLAYCVPSSTRVCAHINLWKVGSAKAMTVPGSSTGSAQNVAVSQGRFGHLWVAWYDRGANKIHVVRTNAAATAFGSVLTLTPPPHLGVLYDVQAEGSAGPLDVIALVQQSTANSTPSYWDTQVLPALRIKGSKASVSNGKSSTITFTVTDAGDAVSGATVRFLGVKAKTNAKGQAKFTIKKGTPKGSHAAAAAKTGYASASFTVKVT